MFNIGAPELILIFFIILLLFGAKRLPEIGRALGKALGEFKKGMKEGTSEESKEEKEE
ncbi:MAG: twin-arginine translocase TatA/TatE family subunit [Candidatus Omnitrophica bacterium]|nr:twin-arginine translocase TatA/TatE family subunit [Candidatus Omnitrophota bacterium]MCM8807898.1 twin-arginine translocase TatA/TatE family subunit [Candidatus Omnitrophota bacterium]